MEKFLILKDSVKTIKRFNLQGRRIEFKLKSLPDNVEPVRWIKNALTDVILYATSNLSPQDQVGFNFCSKNLERGEGWINFKPAEDVDVDDVLKVIQGVFQSNSTGLDTDSFCLGVTSVRMPIGRGRKSGDVNFKDESTRRRGIIVIKNMDNLCLPRALVVAIAKKNNTVNFKDIEKNKNDIQTRMALKLMSEACVNVPLEGSGIPELQQFQNYLKDFKITVYQYGKKGRDVIFEGPSDGKKLNLLHHNNHYNVLISLTAAFCCSYYCENCHVPYDHKNHHRCGGMCPGCFQSPKCMEGQVKVKCDNCLRYFRGESCYNNHKKVASYDRKSTVCSQIKQCSFCLKTIKSDRKHVCGEIFCKICKKHQPGDHLCYIQVDKGFPKLQDILFVFFDFETRQDTVLENGDLLHEVNLCVLKQFCNVCRDSEPWLCDRCGVTTQILDENPLETFVEYILNQREEFKEVIVISHNGGGFDIQFILNKFLLQTDITPELIMRGTKIILMQISNIKFIDSINYFPMALSKLPKALGLDDKFKKGYFPHLFNRRENENYIGPLPAIEYYLPDHMKEEEHKEFLKWWNEQRSNHVVFDFKKELIEYCKSDTTILFESCKRFQQQMIDTTNVCPFSEATTIASTCNKVFRRNFLKPNSIGLIPKKGYRLTENQSKIALQWFFWLEKSYNNIKHAGNGREVILNGVKVDGFCSEINTIFQFHGCYWHGCPMCFKDQRDLSLHDDPSETLNYRYETTTAKSERLRGLGYTVVEKWECEFKKEIQDNPELRLFIKQSPLFTLLPLIPRDAFYGGRTGNTRTYYEVQPGEKIKYVDVCSLYPWVCKYGKFPIGHPKVFVGKECQNFDLKNINGLIKCTVLPPSNLYHPVLPVKMNSKLMFVLCRTCGENMSYDECTHNEKERYLTGTWVIDEILKSIEKGYQILEIFEIWQYDVQRFNSATGDEGLFTAMMNKFIKIKQEASGWPKTCKTEEERNKYINEFFEREDVKLDYALILDNPGLRSLAKLILNSFWGKFGQLECQPKTKIINSPQELFSMLTNPCTSVIAILPVTDETLLVNYQLTEESYDPLSTVNVCIAAYTTAQARLKLYSYLEQLGDKVLYYDTDSVIYIHKEGYPEISIGNNIGEMTDELEQYEPGSYITHFASGGPKNYSYKVFLPNKKEERVVCKVKGICLNYSASKIVNFDSIKNMILTGDSKPIQITSKQIRRTKLHEIVTKTETKDYRPNSLKRKFLENHDSLPYGFKCLRK